MPAEPAFDAERTDGLESTIESAGRNGDAVLS